MFDNLHKFARIVSHHATITERVLQSHGQDRADSIIGVMFLYQRTQRLRFYQRDVPREDQNCAVMVS